MAPRLIRRFQAAQPTVVWNLKETETGLLSFISFTFVFAQSLSGCVIKWWFMDTIYDGKRIIMEIIYEPRCYQYRTNVMSKIKRIRCHLYSLYQRVLLSDQTRKLSSTLVYD